MSRFKLELEQELVALLYQSNQSVENTAREFIILELYRRGTISSGKAAQALAMSKSDFIHYTSRLGIAYLNLTDDEWSQEKKLSESL